MLVSSIILFCFRCISTNDIFISDFYIDMYTVTLTGTTCNGVPTRTGSTISDSVTIHSLEAGIQYSVSVTGRNNIHNLTGMGASTLTTTETGNSLRIICV